MEEVTYDSWGSRIMNSIKGVIIGIVLFFASFVVLFTNEGCAVRRAQTLEAGKGAVVEVKDVSTVDKGKDGQLVHMTGEAETDETLTDPTFNIKVPAIKLRREVQIYQWKENKKTKSEKQLGGGKKRVTTYTYEKVWSDKPINSSGFKEEGHDNKGSLPYKDHTVTVKKVTLGAYELSDALKAQMNKWEPLDIGKEILDAMPADVKASFAAQGNMLYMPINAAATPTPAPSGDAGTAEATEAASPAGGNVKIPSEPNIGDVRITFTTVQPGTVSVMAGLSGNTFTRHDFESGVEPLEQTLKMGTVTAARMFEAKEGALTLQTWGLRIGGFLMMTIGMYLVVAPLVVVADVVPFIGSILGAGAFIVAGVIGFGLSLITISIAWVWYRPWIGIPLLILGAGGIAALFLLRGGKKADGHALDVN